MKPGVDRQLSKQGLGLRLVMPRDRGIHMKDLERVVDRKEIARQLARGHSTGPPAACRMAHRGIS